MIEQNIIDRFVDECRARLGIWNRKEAIDHETCWHNKIKVTEIAVTIYHSGATVSAYTKCQICDRYCNQPIVYLEDYEKEDEVKEVVPPNWIAEEL